MWYYAIKTKPSSFVVQYPVHTFDKVQVLHETSSSLWKFSCLYSLYSHNILRLSSLECRMLPLLSFLSFLAVILNCNAFTANSNLQNRFLSVPFRKSKLSIKIDVKSIVSLLLPSLEQGQVSDRAFHHETKSFRPWTDTMMWTHLFFLCSGCVAFHKKLFDLFVLNAITTVLSLLYHRTYERPGLLPKFEGTSAKLLFAYGAIQLFRAPSPILRLAEIICLLSTISIFLVTNLRKEMYDPYHNLMHVIPPIWVVLVACFHQPLVILKF